MKIMQFIIIAKIIIKKAILLPINTFKGRKYGLTSLRPEVKTFPKT